MANLFRANGSVEEYPDPANGTDYMLTELVNAIGGGEIELFRPRDGRFMVIDDEGKRNGLHRNERATQLFLYGRRSDDLPAMPWSVDTPKSSERGFVFS